MKLLHAADLHLDAPFAALTAEQAARRRAEGRDLLRRLCQVAKEEQVDLVLLSGDLFDGERVYRETLHALRESLASLTMPVFLAPGNHDPYNHHSPYAALDWPANVHLFHTEEVTSVEVPGLSCTVHGTAFLHATEHEDRWVGFRAPTDGRIHIGVAHGEVTSAGSAYHPISLDTIAASGLDYLALGHVHTCSGIQHAGATAWAYPGCPEGHGFDETGDKGCLLVEVETGRAEARFIPLGRRRYLVLEADVTGRSALDAAREALSAATAEDCVKLRLVGQSDLPCPLERLERELGGLVYALRLTDSTRPRTGLWDRAGEDTLTGAFLRQLRERAAAGEETALLAVRFGLAALEGGEDPRP